MSIGEPGHGPPDAVRRAAAQAALTGTAAYAPQAGVSLLRAAITEKLARDGRPHVTPEQVVVTAGASLGIFATLATLCEPGQTVLLPMPSFPLYRLMARTQRLLTLEYGLREDRGFEPDWAAIDEAAPRARVLIWNFPHNPTGAIAREEWIDRLFDVMRRHDHLYLLSDEVYEDYALDAPHISPGGREPIDRLVSAFSFSKSFAIPGWRIGYVHAPAAIADRIARAHWAAAMSTSEIAQSAAVAALAVPTDYRAGVRDRLRRTRNLAVGTLRGAGLDCPWPAGGMFVWPKIAPTGLDSATFAARAAAEARVLVAAGHLFGSDGHVRLSYGADDSTLAQGVARLSAWLATVIPRAHVQPL